MGKIKAMIAAANKIKLKFLYSNAISALYFLMSLIIFFREVSPDQKVIGSVESFFKSEIAKKGTAHKKQLIKQIILSAIKYSLRYLQSIRST